MATTTGSVLTERGAALIAKLHAQQLPLEITRAAVGSGGLPAGDIYTVTELTNYVMDAAILRVIHPSNNQAAIVAQIGSYDVITAFDVTEAAVYANDPDIGEILYAYVSMHDNPEFMPDNSEDIGKMLALDVIILVGHVTELLVTIVPSMFLPREEFEEWKDNLDPDDIGAAQLIEYPNATLLPGANWSTGTPATQTVTVEGMQDTIVPIVDILVSDAVATAKNEIAAWGLIGKIVTGSNTITAYCYDKVPEVALTMQIKAVI